MCTFLAPWDIPTIQTLTTCPRTRHSSSDCSVRMARMPLRHHGLRRSSAPRGASDGRTDSGVGGGEYTCCNNSANVEFLSRAAAVTISLLFHRALLLKISTSQCTGQILACRRLLPPPATSTLKAIYIALPID